MEVIAILLILAIIFLVLLSMGLEGILQLSIRVALFIGVIVLLLIVYNSFRMR